MASSEPHRRGAAAAPDAGGHAGHEELETRDAAETRALGARLATVARAGDMICLWGDLGAGKTVFAKGFGAGLGVDETISSPSFILMSEHEGRLPLFHVDLYRLEPPIDAVAAGLLDERQAEGVVLVEWPDRLGDELPPHRLDVRIAGSGDDPRSVAISVAGRGNRAYLAAIHAARSGRS